MYVMCKHISMYSRTVYTNWAVGHIAKSPCLSFNEALLVYTSHLPPTANYRLLIWIYT